MREVRYALKALAGESIYSGLLALLSGSVMLGIGFEYLFTNKQNISYTRAGTNYQTPGQRTAGGLIMGSIGTTLVSVGGWILICNGVRRRR